jgi:hypothetical protein
MQTTIIICPQCPRVVAVGATLPATCFAAIPESERATITPALDANPLAHANCQQMEVLVPDGLYGDELIKEVERLYAEQIQALHALG